MESDAYYELKNKSMCRQARRFHPCHAGQRLAGAALGLILAQNADLFVLDDFSLALIPATADCLQTICVNVTKLMIRPHS